MKLVLVLTVVLLSGCASAAPTTSLPSLDERPVTKECLTNPPPATDTFNTGMCKTLLGIDAQEQDRDRERTRLSELRTPESGAASESGSTKLEPTHRAQMNRAYEAGRQYRQQYMAAKRPVFQLKFRHQYPTMSEEEIDLLVNDAVEEAMRQETQRLGGGSASPPVSCTSSRSGSFTYTDCY